MPFPLIFYFCSMSCEIILLYFCNILSNFTTSLSISVQNVFWILFISYQVFRTGRSYTNCPKATGRLSTFIVAITSVCGCINYKDIIAFTVRNVCFCPIRSYCNSLKAAPYIFLSSPFPIGRYTARLLYQFIIQIHFRRV